MSYLEFSTSNLTHDDADVIADAFFRAEKDPSRIADILGTSHFDLNLLTHPLVKQKIVAIRNRLNGIYTLEEHLSALKGIRDKALDDDNLKVALTSEIALGRAAGLYDPKIVVEDQASGKEVKKLGTDELRRRLSQIQPKALPEPEDDLPEIESF